MPWLRDRAGRVGATVWINQHLLARMETDAREHSPDESGGMLIGYWSLVGDAVITATVEGGPGAVREQQRFMPDGLWQQERLEDLYVGSGGIDTYLGDWHSHPQGLLRPSRRDRSTAKVVAKTREARAPQPLTMIGIVDAGRWRWEVFRYRRGRGFRRLKLNRYLAVPPTQVMNG